MGQMRNGMGSSRSVRRPVYGVVPAPLRTCIKALHSVRATGLDVGGVPFRKGVRPLHRYRPPFMRDVTPVFSRAGWRHRRS